MPLFSLFLKRRFLDNVSRRIAGRSRMGRSGRLLANPFGQAIVAGIATMLIKRIMRRR
jgi:hypothetical protein